MAGRRRVNSYERASHGTRGSDCGLHSDVIGERIFPRTARGLAPAGAQETLGVKGAFRSFFVLEIREHIS